MNDNNPSPKPVISVVLGSYNRCNYLKYAIRSIRDELEKFKIKTEIIVVDGGSTDGTIKWLIRQKDIISIIQHNRGEWQGKPIDRRSWGYFMNLAFKAAQGKYICMLSDDCLVFPDAILNAFILFEEKLKNNEKIGGIAFYFSNLPEQKEFVINYTIDSTLMINHGLFLKQALEEVNYIDEDNYKFYHADDDLALKLKYSGYHIIDSPDSFIEHFLHANIKLRENIYETESDDLNNLIDKWGKNINFKKDCSIHSSKKILKEMRHESMLGFEYLYKKELSVKKTRMKLNYIYYKMIRFFRNIFMFIYYTTIYVITCIYLLFTDRKMLKQKVKKTKNNIKDKKKLSL